ncbi:YphA family membrane protein [Schinkia azotoformans]|uniref:YphA family membrane protein n=1 Tax=Schinkia azotoformans TaxID=1454 RepID=UPI002DB789A2|nr:hypothetical protein [Schinkia azotoformans]MEC1716751.1 hypothetical protein [Schinkia azotoformans]MEC1746149.1 hypothetical protein [Schinkia azotoformans]MEC1756404.1 hypothetical protein [Schinkia azotoformans]MEC1771731.1 hypothetical protein [Schinkia azotoformans]MED4366828.1 hypothetical protein [Schinkia azotoformans]
MEGIYFYWFSWIGWVITTFFMKKGKVRTTLSFFILFMIIGGDITYHLTGYSIHAPFILLFFFSLVFIAKTKGFMQLYYLICSLIISIGYVCFHLFELFDPVWLIFDRKWMLSFVILYLILMLVKDPNHRLAVALMGICNGELLYSMILTKFFGGIEIGNFVFLDALAFNILFILIWNSFEKIVHAFEANIYKGKAGRVQR